MEVTSVSSWIVSSAAWRTVIFLAYGAMGATVSYTETLTGIVYSNEIGNGTHPAGRIELAVGKRMHNVEYGEPLERRFQGTVCNDIGAEWSVVVQHVEKRLYANRVTCTGHTNDDVHQPWLLVRHYLEGLPSSLSQTSGFSSRYLSSPEFRSFASLAQRVDSRYLSFYFGVGEADKCLKAVSVEPATRTHLATHCAITLQGQYVVLLFDVVRSKGTGNWEIDGINVE